MKERPLGNLPCVQRDLITAIAANPESNGQELWSAVEKMRQNTIGERTIYEHLDELSKGELVEKDTWGARENQYELSFEGEKVMMREKSYLLEVL